MIDTLWLIARCLSGVAAVFLGLRMLLGTKIPQPNIFTAIPIQIPTIVFVLSYFVYIALNAL